MQSPSSIPYSALRTSDYDEPHEVEDSNRRQLRKGRSNEDLESLSNSIDRIGQLGLHIAGEIELQSNLANQMNDITDDMNVESHNLQRQANIAGREEYRTNVCLGIFILVVLTISVTILVYKKYFRQKN